jgi:hypothetical protein
MKKKVFAGIAVLTFAAVSMLNMNLESIENRYLSLAMINIEALADDESDCPDDEQNISATQDDCKNGKNCECTLCISGSTDCTPTCPCC